MCIFLVSAVMTVVLLDSQLYTAHRFHFSLLTIRILGWKTWGFGVLYLIILIVFNGFLSSIVWKKYIIQKKKMRYCPIIISFIISLLFTHGTHIWADAAGYTPVTGFTTTLPMFYPSTGKKQMVKFGIVDISNRRGRQSKYSPTGSLRYPLNKLSFSRPTNLNILIIAVDAMRSDMLSEETSPKCMKFAKESAEVFTDHWSGGNSTKMGLFSLFYGLPPTYQQYIESNKISPVMIDRLLEEKYITGIFTSHPLYRPACLDVTAFVKIPDLRLETVIPGPAISWRNDSAITDQWKEWIDKKNTERPFFGFLFYDALCNGTYPAYYERLIPETDCQSSISKDFRKYRISMLYIDSLIGEVLEDLGNRKILDSTIVIITSDHGNEFDDNGLGIRGHGSAFSDFQLRVPLVVYWPGKTGGVINKRTNHNDVVATLMKHAFGCNNQPSDYCSGEDLFSGKGWDWFIAGSYYNFAIIEPNQVVIQFPGGYYEVRDHRYRLINKPSFSLNIEAALAEMGRFFVR